VAPSPGGASLVIWAGALAGAGAAFFAAFAPLAFGAVVTTLTGGSSVVFCAISWADESRGVVASAKAESAARALTP
jgi:hypothetical protein